MIPVQKATRVLKGLKVKRVLQVHRVREARRANKAFKGLQVRKVLPVTTELMPLSPELQLLLMPTPVHRPLL